MQNYRKLESTRLPKMYTKEPLAIKILFHHEPQTFKFPKMFYDGCGEPQDLLAHYINPMNILGASDEMKCKAFFMTLND